MQLFLLFLLSYPLAVPLAYLSATAKHVVNIAVTTFYLYGILGLKASYLQLLANCLVTYYLTCFNVGGKRNMPWIVFGFQMGHLTINHLVRTFGNIPLTTIEITAMQMVLCMNLTTFAWSMHDGKNRKAEECDEQQRSMRIVDSPSLLEFLGYAFYFPGVLIGPSTRFTDYRAWATGELYRTKDGNPPPGRFRAGLTELVFGMLFMGLWTVLSPKFYYEALLLPASEPGSALAFGFLGRVAYIAVAGIAARAKYYGIWTLTNGACIVSGMAYNGTAADGRKVRWDRCKNINVAGVEFANNWKELLDNWNMNTNVWLRNNVYKRVARPGKKPGFKSTMATFMTSAFWHGVAPGYYLTFVLGGLLQSVGRSMRAHLRPFVFTNVRAPNPTFSTLANYSPAQLVYCTLSVILVQLTVDFTALPFIMLDVRSSLAGWCALYYYGLLAAIIPMIAVRAGVGRMLDNMSGVTAAKRKERQDREKAAAAASGNPQVPDVDVVEKEAVKAGQEAKEKIEEQVNKKTA